MTDITINNVRDLDDVLNKIEIGHSIFQFPWSLKRSYIPSGFFIEMEFTRPDCNTGIEGIGKTRKLYLDWGCSESALVKTVWVLFNLLVTHELMENYLYKGKRIFNPHNSVNLLGSIQNDV